MAAYGVREGNQRYTEFRNTQIAGQYIGSFRNMPTSSITAYVNQLKPTPEQTGRAMHRGLNYSTRYQPPLRR